VALIGRVGSGKSTIQRLIMGLYQPTEGAVLIDGIDLRQLDPADVRRNQAYVSQDVTLFYGSLRENIAFGLPYADDSAVATPPRWPAWPTSSTATRKGFDMPVGERGESLSGGQRQCVGLARAVLHNAPILLLDEPTSAMDFSTEAQITQRWRLRRGKTVVLVTHRTSMLAMVNRVIVIDGGKVVADGPRDRIMEALAARADCEGRMSATTLHAASGRPADDAQPEPARRPPPASRPRHAQAPARSRGRRP
jgi:ATP-binding cassette, subfamily C, bacterial LapB